MLVGRLPSPMGMLIVLGNGNGYKAVHHSRLSDQQCFRPHLLPLRIVWRCVHHASLRITCCIAAHCRWVGNRQLQRS